MKNRNFPSRLIGEDLQSTTLNEIEWRISKKLLDYPHVVGVMENRVDAIHKNIAPELVWLLEHPPMYTAGTSAKPEDLLSPTMFPVYKTGRGGQHTYHGPGQRVVYAMLDLKKRGADLKGYVNNLEKWIIATLAEFNISGFQRVGRVGIWIIDKDNKEKKIAAIGIRVRRWISYHGISINLNPELKHYNGIIPCGIPDFGITSLHELGRKITLKELDFALRQTFLKLF